MTSNAASLWTSALGLAMLCAAAPAFAQEAAPVAPQQPPPTTSNKPAESLNDSTIQHVKPEITSVSLQDIDPDKAMIAVGLSMTSDRDLDLSGMTVSRLRLNGLPVFASPLAGPIHLTKGQTWVAPTPLAVTIYLRDMASLQPLMTAVSSGTLSVEGEVVARVQLGKMQKMVLFSSQATVPVRFHQEVTLDVPGGAFGRGAAGLVLAGANATMEKFKEPVQGMLGGLRAQLKASDLPRIATVSATYDVVDSAGKATQIVWTGTAFFLDQHQLVTVAEALEPWTFDSDVELAVRSGQYKVNPASLHLTVTPATGSTPLELGKDLTVASNLSQKKQQIMMPRDNATLPVRAQVALRAEPQNLAILNVTGTAPQVIPVKPADLTVGKTWDQVAVFRGIRNDSKHLGEIEILLLPATYENGRIQLRSMVDSDAFGSPVIGPDGILGVIQDESTALPWPEATKSLKLK